MNSGAWAIKSNQNDHSFAVHRGECSYVLGPQGWDQGVRQVCFCILLIFLPLLVSEFVGKPLATLRHVDTRTAERLAGGAQVAAATLSHTPQLLLASQAGVQKCVLRRF